ncbi:hypothetical protein KBX08_03180 [Micromonospora sp. H61]|nr:hypothetical protein [Micromonospora sp. H61]
MIEQLRILHDGHATARLGGRHQPVTDEIVKATADQVAEQFLYRQQQLHSEERGRRQNQSGPKIAPGR